MAMSRSLQLLCCRAIPHNPRFCGTDPPLESFTSVRNEPTKMRLLASPRLSVCLSVRLDGTARQPLRSFSRNVALGSFTKICRHVLILVKNGKQ
jgi:hypothetical protein